MGASRSIGDHEATRCSVIGSASASRDASTPPVHRCAPTSADSAPDERRTARPGTSGRAQRPAAHIRCTASACALGEHGEPAGALPPLVKPHSIDDVPVLALTLHSSVYDANMLRQVAVHLEDEIRTIPDVAETFVVGGQPKQVRVTLDAARLAASGVTPGEVAQALRSTNARVQAGELTASGEVYRIDAGAPLVTTGDVNGVVVAPLRRRLHSRIARAGLLGEPGLVAVHRLRGRQSGAIELHELLSARAHTGCGGMPRLSSTR